MTRQNTKGVDPNGWLSLANEVVLPGPTSTTDPFDNLVGPVRVGVDLGTAYTVLVVTDETGCPLTGEYLFTNVTRDGLVVDFIGAVDILRAMKQRIERRLGFELTHAASGYPPGVPLAEVRATAHVVEAAGMSCPELVDEPTAANNVLGLENGIIVDIGGGTTGIAILENGKVVKSFDEPTGGTHFSLVIAGATGMSFEEAEIMKKDISQQSRLYPLVRPVMQKVGTIINKYVNGNKYNSITLVGGSSLFPGFEEVVEEVTGIQTSVAPNPLLVTPLGIALHDLQGLSTGG